MLKLVTPANLPRSHGNCHLTTFARQLPRLLVGRRFPKRYASRKASMSSLRLFAAIAVLATSGIVAAGDEQLPPPAFKVSLVCFNGRDGAGSSCRSTMAQVDGGLKVINGKLTCGYKDTVSEITWTYRGQKDGKDLYHVVRKFPLGSNDAKVTETDVSFDGNRHVLFQDKAQCIVIEPQPAEK